VAKDVIVVLDRSAAWTARSCPSANSGALCLEHLNPQDVLSIHIQIWSDNFSSSLQPANGGRGGALLDQMGASAARYQTARCWSRRVHTKSADLFDFPTDGLPPKGKTQRDLTYFLKDARQICVCSALSWMRTWTRCC
jgi:hypothetical protein